MTAERSFSMDRSVISQEESSTRGGFFRSLAKTAAIGSGLALAGASVARAEQLGYCCPNQCQTCTNSIPFMCFDSCGGGSSCCVCVDFAADCFNINCPCGGGLRKR